MFVFQLFIACLFACALGVREAFRYQLLTSSMAKSSTILSVLVLLAWIGVIIWSTITTGILYAAATLVISFVLGNVARLLSTARAGRGPWSPEAAARTKYENEMAASFAETAVNDAQFRGVIQRFGLNSNDLKHVYDAARRVGLEHEVALHAMKDPKVVTWYFENVGTDGRFTLDTSLHFLVLAKNSIGERRVLYWPSTAAAPPQRDAKSGLSNGSLLIFR